MQSTILAVTQIKSNLVRSTLTTLGIVIAVAAVTAVIAALAGLKAKVLSEFETIGTNSIYIFPYKPDTGPYRHARYDRIQFKPEIFEGMLDHCPSLSSYTFICSSAQNIQFKEEIIENCSLQGITAMWHQIENRSVTEGRPFSQIDQGGAKQVCLITPEVRKELHLDRDCIGQKIFLGSRSFRIIGIVEETTSAFGIGQGQKEVFIPFETAWKQIDYPSMRVVATSRTPEQSDEAVAELSFFLRNRRGLNPGEPDTFMIRAVEDAIEQFNMLAVAITAVASGIVGISLLVGGVGIMNIMLVSVSERTREIGLRKAVGARPSAILLQFLVEAIVLCMLGGLIGLGGGQLLTYGIASIPNAQMDQAYIPLWAIVLAFGFSALVGIFFGLFPAAKAASLDPIEALRHE
ncbi:MAG: FtsX-like permease family protein [Planctomycetes bacterium]|nr:FtsX-like permease family protein [Planctomycetota bacterium]